MDHIDGEFASWLLVNHDSWPLQVKAQALTDVSGRVYAYHILYARESNGATDITTVLPKGLKWLEDQGMIRREAQT